MATMSTKKRDKLPAKAFAGPDRSYPVNDKAHAANAKARVAGRQRRPHVRQREVEDRRQGRQGARRRAEARRAHGEAQGQEVILPQAVSARTAAAADVLEASGLRRIPELVLATGGSNSLNERSMT